MNVKIPEEAENNIKRLILFLHEALGCPTKSTLIKAVKKGHLATWPGLTVKRINKYIKGNIINAKGHMHMSRQSNKRSRGRRSQLKDNNTQNIEEEALNPTQETDNIKTNLHYAKIEETDLYGTDQTGKFPYRSKRGNKYIFVLYNYDSNSILSRPMKNRTDAEFLRVHDDVIEYLKVRGLQPKIQRLDNEASKAYTQNIDKHKMKFQLTPAQMHRKNIAERAIQTFKNHFITILAGANNEFPKNEWDLLLPQSETTINMLRSSRINPRLSAEEQMNGTFDYNTNPMAPLGIKVLAYEMPSHRASWAEHGQEGWYIGPAYDHHQCYRVLIKSTRGLRTPPKVKFYPERSPMPTNSSTDNLLRAETQLTHALNNPSPPVPFEHVGDEEVIALNKLAAIFQKKAQAATKNTNKPIHKEKTRAVVKPIHPSR